MSGGLHLRNRSSTRSTNAWRRPLGLLLIGLLFITLVFLSLNVGPGRRLMTQMVTGWADQMGIQLDLGSVQMVGLGRFALDDVELHSLPDPSVTGISVKRVILSFELLGLLRGERGSELLTEVTLVAPDVTLSLREMPSGNDLTDTSDHGLSEEAASNSHRNGFKWPLDMGPISIVVKDGRYALHGTGQDIQGTVELQSIAQSDHVELTRFDATLASSSGTGRVTGAARLNWNTARSALTGTLLGDSLELKMHEDVYSLDTFDAAYHWSEGIFHLDSFVGQRGDAQVELQGQISGGSDIDLAVAADRLNLATDLPLLGRIGFSGPGSFAGRLTGTLDHLVLQGVSQVGPGDVWGRPNVTGSGEITLSAEGLRFAGVQLRQYGGEYTLDGSYAFGKEDPGYVDLQVQTQSGRVQELLAVLGWDLGVSGRLYGDLHFKGELGAIKAAGTLEVLEAVAWNQPFDRAHGSFAWNDGLVLLNDVQVALGTGSAMLDGSIELNGDEGQAQIDISANDWPLGFTRLFEERLGHVLGGLINIRNGRLSGPLSSPHLHGVIEAQGLRVGPTLFRSVQGRMAYKDRTIELSEVDGLRAGGGAYSLSGTIRFPESGEPTTDLAMTISDERLRSLLQLANEELPAALIDGNVSGSVRVTGQMSDPEAELDLLLQETLALRRGVRIAMRFANGALRISEIDLAS